MAQSLSDEEFHRMQIQIIELRTENYKLKDENKKQAKQLKDLIDKETRLDRELNKQIKLKRALSTLNKSKQAQEYEAILHNTEEEFSLQNQTLMKELERLTVQVEKLEKENKSLEGKSNETSSESFELRKVQAQNTALQKTIEIQNLYLLSMLHQTFPKAVGSPMNSQTSVASSITSSPSNISDEHIEVKLVAEHEEKLLLQKELDSQGNRNSREQRAFTDEVESLREKFERKQAAFVKIQEEMEHMHIKNQDKLSEITQLHEAQQKAALQEKDKLSSEVASLGKALQNSHNMLDGMQDSMSNLQAQVKLHEEEMRIKVSEKNEMKSQLDALQQRLSQDEQKKFDSTAQMKSLEMEMSVLRSEMERSRVERDEAVTKFEDNVRASGALLERVNEIERQSDALRQELRLAEELAEKRKKVMDQQAVESHENNDKFTKRINTLISEHQSTTAQTVDNYESKIKLLEETCKRQEQELIRINHQDRLKTRELDSLQQQIRDNQSTILSLENSSGWFERALKDVEKSSLESKQNHQTTLNEMKAEHEKELEVEEAELRVVTAMNETSLRDATIERMKQDIQDEVSKQKLMEKKGHQALKDLKRQLVIEKKRSEKLQEKIKDISSSNSNLDELLQVVDLNDRVATGEDSSVSSFSFRDLISSKPNPSDSGSQAGSSFPPSIPVATVSVSKAESRDLLARLTAMQQEKWNLEEKVQHLEESAGAMADELVEKTKLLQQYVHHTRSELASRTFGNRVRSMITGQEETDVTNVRELNRKLTRMLEEEMTKNMAL
uniref:GRIP1-associated protein 1 n=1 Tax=Ciona savignyi TaxID=51511 RepID=H2ZJH3_CIOSA